MVLRGGSPLEPDHANVRNREGQVGMPFTQASRKEISLRRW